MNLLRLAKFIKVLANTCLLSSASGRDVSTWAGFPLPPEVSRAKSICLA